MHGCDGSKKRLKPLTSSKVQIVGTEAEQVEKVMIKEVQVGMLKVP
jgi:hypothetical protein